MTFWTFFVTLHQKLLLETPLGRIMACFQHQIVDGSKSWIVMPSFHIKIANGSKSWIAHATVSFKNSLWKQAMNGSWHRFNPNTIVKAIHVR
ncbi:hypothetical protein ACFPTR_07335 [Aliibacillus thermotolerans]|uniref:Uncharacterized protein n=1 Tax=Aliibacillus thermotolerans TaxID=1834418 RepID=A0ABW0U7H4_9BACI|nr:hypothetical protein [Aliibacillus thermotolerans]MDA3129004.1 hypothetical protein [Aliibacillus thermotolerans]